MFGLEAAPRLQLNVMQGFYINLVVGAVLAPAYILLFPSIDPQPGKTLSQKCRMIDWINSAVFLAGSACLTIAISFGGVLFAFSSETMIALWAVTGILFVASVLLTKYHPLVDKENKLYPAHFLKRPILVIMQIQVFLSSGIILVSRMNIHLMLFWARLTFSSLGSDILHTTILSVCAGMPIDLSRFELSLITISRVMDRSTLAFDCCH